MFKVSEFAEKAGVTVRTLHHYEKKQLAIGKWQNQLLALGT